MKYLPTIVLAAIFIYRKYVLIALGIGLLILTYWAQSKGMIDHAGNLSKVLYLAVCILLAIGFRTKLKNQHGKCPHCGAEGIKKEIFKTKGKVGRGLVTQCVGCHGGVYLYFNGDVKEIPPDEWEAIEEVDRGLRQSI